MSLARRFGMGRVAKLFTSLFLVGALLFTSLVNISWGGALSVSSVNPGYGSIGGGETITIQGDFAVQGLTATMIDTDPHGNYACAIDTVGQIYCWTRNASYYAYPTAVDMTGVLSGRTFTQISTGAGIACVLDNVGRVYCWTTQYSLGVPYEVDMYGKIIKQVSAGGASGTSSIHACALDTTGFAYCWGDGGHGKLGDGTGNSSSTPVAVYTAGVLNGVSLTQISAGGNHTCAIDTAGKAYCWGYGYYGQLGRGSTTSTGYPAAVNMSGVLNSKTLKSISTGDYHTCAIDTAGKAYCWGYNYYGQLGNGLTTNSPTPVEVDMTGVLSGKILTEINANGNHACAVDTGGQLYCWGDGNNYNGTFGVNQKFTSASTPVLLLPISDFYQFDFAISIGGSRCNNVVIASGGGSLTCKTSFHLTPGVVDIVINDGVDEVVLPNSYEYIGVNNDVDAEPTSATASHTLQLNIYDSTNISTLTKTCDDIRAEQAANGTYTQESYDALMEACEEAEDVLNCIEQAMLNNTDASECGDPDDTEDIEDAMEKLEPVDKPGNPPRPGGKALPPNTGSTWYTTIFGKDYAIPIVPFVILSIATLAGIGLTVFLTRRRITKQGISGIKIPNPWSRNSYELVYERKLAKKHADDPLTEIIDVSNIVRKYRIKYTLWHTVPTLAIVFAFFTLIITTAPTMADSEYADISLSTIDSSSTTILNIDKATVGNAFNATANITAINTDIHDGGNVDMDGGVYAKYVAKPLPGQSSGDFMAVSDNMTLNATQTTPGGMGLSSVDLSGSDQLIVPSNFVDGDLNDDNVFPHALNMSLDNIEDIPVGIYNFDIEYLLTAKEPVFKPVTTGTWNSYGNFIALIHSNSYDSEALTDVIEVGVKVSDNLAFSPDFGYSAAVSDNFGAWASGLHNGMFYYRAYVKTSDGTYYYGDIKIGQYP